MSEFNPKRTSVVEPLGSTRTPSQPVDCQCLDKSHQHHLGDSCGNDVFKEGLCRDCLRALGGSTSASDE